MEESEELFFPGLRPSMTQVLREMKRQENGLYNCMLSVLEDAAFVRHVQSLYPGLPVFANLRCGLWYVANPSGTCYFKSTDGHTGNWSFSTVRLNLHVAAAAAEAGGCIIVDATRRGKRFPDALSKTIPQWAAVVNRAVARLQVAEQGAGRMRAAPAEQHGVHLPPWLPGTEAQQISHRLDGWVDQLLEVGADLSELVARVRKPLRCLWVSQESRIWVDEMPDVGAMPFAPLVLVSASLPNARQRRCLSVDGLPPVMYEYVPGAGDDEESWARGLTPQLMWAHAAELVQAGPDECPRLVGRLLRGSERQRPSGSAAARRRGSAAAGCLPAAAEEAAVAPGCAAANGQRGLPHALLPAGCSAALPGAARMIGCGAFLVGDTGLAVGPASAVLDPGIWQHVDCLLNVGVQSTSAGHGAAAQPARPGGGAQPTSSAAGASGSGLSAPGASRAAWLPVASSKADRHALQRQLPSILRLLAAHLLAGRRVLVQCDSGTDACVCATLACLLACFRLTWAGAGASGSGPALELCPVAAAAAAAGRPAPAAPEGFGKLQVRRYLAALTACYPQARPTSGMLRQVFVFFHEGGLAAASAEAAGGKGEASAATAGNAAPADGG